MLIIYNRYMFDTIAAISTGGMTNDPISIIRVGGADAFNVVKKIFTGKVGTDKTITYGYIKDGDTKIDEVLVAWFVGPKTFTGENIVEINAHGGIVNTNKILQLLLANGARLAQKGEFSRRGFLNGKMDLVKAEAIHDLIFAKTPEQAQLSVKKFDGHTSSLIDSLNKKLLEVIATIETNIDYPEYDDIEILTQENLLPRLKSIDSELNEILESSKSSRYIFEGVNVAIVGKPNAGKSSLLNAFLNEDKAIVTDVPGTTRDVVEGSIQVGQVLLNFKDTAGIHSTTDKVEQLGIKKSLDQIDNADLVLHVIDSSATQDEDDLKIEQASKIKPYIKVFNKSDIKKLEGVSISAKEKNIDNLLEAIKNIYKDIDLNNDKIVNNTRQLALIDSAKIAINEAINGLQNGLQPDTVIVDITKAWEDLGNIMGRPEETDLLDQMFKSFCLGK